MTSSPEKGSEVSSAEQLEREILELLALAARQLRRSLTSGSWESRLKVATSVLEPLVRQTIKPKQVDSEAEQAARQLRDVWQQLLAGWSKSVDVPAEVDEDAPPPVDPDDPEGGL